MIAKTAILLLLFVGIAAAQTNAPPPTNSNSNAASKSNAPAPPLLPAQERVQDLVVTNGSVIGTVQILTPAEERALGLRGEEIRTQCVQNRRYVCGRILQIFPDGLVVDSGYSRLLQPPLNHSWLVSGAAVVERDPHLVESKEPDAICVGLVFLTDIPKSRRRPKPKLYDYVVAHGYPAGERTYTSVGTVKRTVRRYSMGLEYAVSLILGDEANQAKAAAPASAPARASASEAK